MLAVSDEQLEREMRRRTLGEPWSPEETVSLLNRALDLLTTTNRTTRARKFTSEAGNLLEILTGEISPHFDLRPVGREEAADEDYFIEPMIVNDHPIQASTMRKVIDMAERTNGQKNDLMLV